VIPNRGDGILISGSAHNNAVGGFQPSTEPQNTIASNGRYGIQVSDSAHNNSQAGNGITIRSSSNNVVMENNIRGNQCGIWLSASRNNIIGSPAAGNEINENGQYGVYVAGKVNGTCVQGNSISTNATDGVMLAQAQSLMLGGSDAGAGNPIVLNQGYGLYAHGVCKGSVVQANTIVANAQGSVNLTNSKGITYIPR
jgi:parallel beta-helix repeat protein